MSSRVLTFRTQDQIILWQEEIMGQISDGQWENARPWEHWKDWSEAEVRVGPNVGRNFHTRKDNYNLTSSDLLQVVGKRMMTAVKIGRAFGPEHVRTLSYCFEDLNFKGLPKYAGKYWDDIRQNISRFNLATVEAQVAAVPYEIKHLRADLREMKAAMRHFNG